jgi:predicted ATPase
MIKRIGLKNFRAFKSAEFSFSRINIFIGPNNSGKSSALSALNVIGQSIRDNQAGSPIVLRGKYQDLGTYIDVVHGGIPRTVMGIEVDINEFSYKVDFKYRTLRKDIDVQKYEIYHEGKALFSYKVNGEKYDIKYKGKSFDVMLPGIAKRKPEFSSFVVDDTNLRQIGPTVNISHPKYKNIPENKLKELYGIQRLLSRSRRILSQEFDNFDSLSPFRAPPERTFLFSGETPNEVGKDGGRAIDMLVADNFTRGSINKRILEGVCEWFKSTGMAKGLAVNPLTSRHFEVVMISEDGEHNICDVGFGCSQVLPVLVGGFNTFLKAESKSLSDPIFIVQEPEIHLHPNAQAELGTYFANLIGERGQLFIETHSDTMILRLQRHIADGDLKPEDVKLFFVRNDISGTKEVTEIELNKEGVFDKEMPGGFFPQRQKESLSLAKAAASRRKRSGEIMSTVEIKLSKDVKK